MFRVWYLSSRFQIKHLFNTMTLYIRPHNEEIRMLLIEQILKHRPTDSGFDIPMRPLTLDLNKNQNSIGLEISVSAETEEGVAVPCLLLPRSSIYKLPIRLCNSIGLIDMGYRGELQAKVDVLDWRNKAEPEYIRLDDGYRLFQLCQHSFLPWKKIVLQDDLLSGVDDRGEGGFGSTG